MDQHIDEVMRPGLEAEKFAVRLVGQPGEGMPVVCVKGGERPFEIRPIQPAFDGRIFSDVVRVVLIDKLIPVGRQENQQRHQGEEQGNSART